MLFVMILAGVALAAPWPLNTGFEPPEYTVGALHGQQGWTAINDVAVTAESVAVYEGSQGVRLTSSSQAVYDADATAESVVWVQGFCKTEAVNFYPDLPAPSGVTCFLFFHATDGIVCLDGDGAGSGTWKTTGVMASEWTRLSIRQDYASNTWDLYINGQRRFSALGNAYHGAAFDRFEAQAGDTGPMYLDTFYSSAQTPFTGFGMQQKVAMASDGQSGVFVYNYNTFALNWVEGSGTYNADFNLAEQQWYGVFLYDYTSASYSHGLYYLKESF